MLLPTQIIHESTATTLVGRGPCIPCSHNTCVFMQDIFQEDCYSMLQLHMHVQDLPLNLRCKMIITNQVIPPMHPVVYYPPPLLLSISQARFTSETILLQTWKTRENTTNCPGGSTTAEVPTEWYSHTSQRSNPKWWSWCHSKLAIHCHHLGLQTHAGRFCEHSCGWAGEEKHYIPH